MFSSLASPAFARPLLLQSTSAAPRRQEHRWFVEGQPGGLLPTPEVLRHRGLSGSSCAGSWVWWDFCGGKGSEETSGCFPKSKPWDQA